MSDVTLILSQIELGDPSAAEQLLPLVYDELRKLAAMRLDDAYIRLVDVEKAQHWNSRGHFFAAAAEAMRRILIDNARRKGRLKRDGSLRRVDLENADLLLASAPADLLDLDDALSRLAAVQPLAAKIANLISLPALRSSKRETPLAFHARQPSIIGLMHVPG